MPQEVHKSSLVQALRKSEGECSPVETPCPVSAALQTSLRRNAQLGLLRAMSQRVADCDSSSLESSATPNLPVTQSSPIANEADTIQLAESLPTSITSHARSCVDAHRPITAPPAHKPQIEVRPAPEVQPPAMSAPSTRDVTARTLAHLMWERLAAQPVEIISDAFREPAFTQVRFHPHIAPNVHPHD